jgi:hypothetical protein
MKVGPFDMHLEKDGVVSYPSRSLPPGSSY